MDSKKPDMGEKNSSGSPAPQHNLLKPCSTAQLIEN